MKESRTLELKEQVSNTFLKTVSAFANYGGGEILFGVSDQGEVRGLARIEQQRQDIENRINDSISPCPAYRLSVQQQGKVIALTIAEGLQKPYLYKGKAYRRSDTATVEVDRVELMRLVLEGQTRSYDSTSAKEQQLQFTVLEQKLQQTIGIGQLNLDILKTLELYQEKEGYTVAGALLADRNNYAGIDTVRFGDSISVMLDRELYQHMSILSQFDQAVRLYRKYYQREEIQGVTRETVELVPEKAFREAIANALVHRTWDVSAHIRVSMHPDRIEISSPGGLPPGVSEKEYLAGQLSILRNPLIGNLFFRLNLIERFGTGVRRILDAYRASEQKPRFVIHENSVLVILPLLTPQLPLTGDERLVYQAVAGRQVASSDVVLATGFSKSKVVSLLNRLVGQGYVRQQGRGRGTTYTA